MYPLLLIFSDKAIFFLRVVLGVILAKHGWPKVKDRAGTDAWFQSVGFRPGLFWGPVAAAVEFCGGLALIFGLGAKYVAILVAGQFVVIIIWRLLRHEKLSDGMEQDLLILAAAAALATLGSGAWALDAALGWF